MRGSGIVAFHFYAINRGKVPLTFELFELQEELLALAEKSAKLNGFANFSFHACDLKREKFGERFSLVLCNPPYERGGFENGDPQKAICRKEITITLRDIAAAAGKALKFGGRIALVNRADRLAEVAYTLKEYNIELKRRNSSLGRKGISPTFCLRKG